jgi:hypothetical protein
LAFYFPQSTSRLTKKAYWHTSKSQLACHICSCSPPPKTDAIISSTTVILLSSNSYYPCKDKTITFNSQCNVNFPTSNPRHFSEKYLLLFLHPSFRVTPGSHINFYQAENENSTRCHYCFYLLPL